MLSVPHSNWSGQCRLQILKKQSDVAFVDFTLLNMMFFCLTKILFPSQLFCCYRGGSPKSDVGQNQKTSFFANGQFSGYLIFYKKTFFGENNFSTPINKNFIIFEKKHFFLFFFAKKNVFFGNVFSKFQKAFRP